MSERNLAKSLIAALQNPKAALTEISRLDSEESLEEFIRQAWHVLEPGTKYRHNWHISTICGYLEAFAERRITRLIINVPPGCMKSLIVSVFYPAWIWARDPGHRFLAVANGDTLAVRDSQKMKWLVESDWFQSRWPVQILKDQSGKGLFGNKSKGLRHGIGITANVTGLRGDTMLWDDLIDAEKANSEAEAQAVIGAIDNKLISRLNDMDNGGICLIMQRLSESDPTGHLLKSKYPAWTHLVIPMEYDGARFDANRDIGRPELNDPRKIDGELLDPNRFPITSVNELKERLGTYGAAGQLQQRPVQKGGGILKSSAWRLWPKDKPLPICLHIFASYDTAYTEIEAKSNSYSARTTWGVFQSEETGKYAMIMLEGWFDRVDYPTLRKDAKKHHKDFGCDRALIEKKASGQSLIQDFRRANIPVSKYDPGRMDKIARAHLASPMFEQQLVFYPDKQWSRNIVEFVSKFPKGSPPSSDLTDTVTQAVLYVQRRRWMELPDDEVHEPPVRDITEDDFEDNDSLTNEPIYS